MSMLQNLKIGGLILLAVGIVLVTNWFLDGVLYFFLGEETVVEGDSLLELVLRGLFFLVDIATIGQIFLWLRR